MHTRKEANLKKQRMYYRILVTAKEGLRLLCQTPNAKPSTPSFQVTSLPQSGLLVSRRGEALGSMEPAEAQPASLQSSRLGSDSLSRSC